ncbi:ComEA family DNA-binding protein [Candidatus Solirubrobacter pratensis]|uniref:ComEA family DNA-binding protein n=1 Tax=Candidatus Solirubrobacter pratensis TaxID=1298857 RepID=UPI0004033F19|nr:ComEA family DNA-binding protein [Candidatus Solirubrobacter pratensis]
MPDRDPRKLAAWGVAALALVLLTAWYLSRSSAGESAAAVEPVATIAAAPEEQGVGGRLVIDVAGAVRKPGVYRMAQGDRVEDALKEAGGATAHADLSQLNRAAKLEDGRQILVPRRAPRGRPAAAAATAAAPSTPAQPVNLNTATLEQLDTLDGVGPATAQKIIDFRTAHGGFGSIDELDQIPGIGEKKLAALREQVTV